MFDLERAWLRKAAFGLVVRAARTLSPVYGGSWKRIFDWRPGAWQSDAPFQADSRETILAFGAVYSATTGIAGDVSKLAPILKEVDENGIWTEVKNSPFSRVLVKPNRFQTRIQFYLQWVLSLLVYGNTYALKERDARGMVVAMYLLDPCKVTVLVADDGGVYYQLAEDYLSRVDGQITVPASEIIHDRIATLWHPLIGVSPIFACGITATQGNRIQSHSAKFFENMSRPSGMLTAPGSIDIVTATRLRDEFEKKFGGGNIGRVMVGGDGLKYEAMTIPAQDAQLIEQLRWTVEDVGRCFHYPMWKLGGPMPAYGNSEMAQQAYYSETLQNIIEGIEVLLDEGLGVPANYGVEFDLSPLLRMDTNALFTSNSEGVRGGWLAPDEARRRANYKPVAGGASPMAQQQQYSLAALAQRDAMGPPPSTTPLLPAPTPTDTAKALADALIAKFSEAAPCMT